MRDDVEGMERLIVELDDSSDWTRCGDCPLHFEYRNVMEDVEDECSRILMRLSKGMCREVRKTKIREIQKYLLERALREGKDE